MVMITWLIPYLGGAVDAYLTIISILDMPLFVVAIVYGLLWKKATWQGAVVGYATGAITGAVLRFGFNFDVALVTILSGGVAFLACPVISLMTRASDTGQLESIFRLADREGPPKSFVGEETSLATANTGTWILATGFLIFLAGVFMGSQSFTYDSVVAIAGMLIYFAGGILRAKAV